MTWHVEGVRCSCFYVSGDDPKVEWEKRFGVLPGSVTEKPQQRLKQYRGRVGAIDLRAVVAADRIDWIWSNPGGPRVVGPGAENRFIGRYEEVTSSFKSIIEKWLVDQSIIRRLAFGCVLVLPFGQTTDAADALQKYLPNFKIPLKSPSDFLLQVNRPRISSVFADMPINRLSRWSITETMVMDVPIAGVENPTQPHFSKGVDLQVDLDINIPAQAKVLQSDKIVPLWGELVGFAGEIAERGDCE